MSTQQLGGAGEPMRGTSENVDFNGVFCYESVAWQRMNESAMGLLK